MNDYERKIHEKGGKYTYVKKTKAELLQEYEKILPNLNFLERWHYKYTKIPLTFGVKLIYIIFIIFCIIKIVLSNFAVKY